MPVCIAHCEQMMQFTAHTKANHRMPWLMTFSLGPDEGLVMVNGKQNVSSLLQNWNLMKRIVNETSHSSPATRTDGNTKMRVETPSRMQVMA